MKTESFFISLSILVAILFLTGCVAPAPYPPPSYGYGAPGYVAPVAPPVGVQVVAPIGLAPGPYWNWAYHPRYGWGWHHPGYGWRHR